MAELPIHPDIMEIVIESEKRRAELYDTATAPLQKAHTWARENIGELASEHLAGDKPEFRSNAKRYAQTVFDALVPNPSNPVDLAMAFFPAFSREEALGKIARSAWWRTGKRLPGEGVKELVDVPLSAFKEDVWKPLRGPRHHHEGWGYTRPAVDYAEDFMTGAPQIDFRPGGITFHGGEVGREVGQVFGTHPGTYLSQIEAQAMGKKAPLYRHQSGFGHELTHDIYHNLPSWAQKKMFGGKVPDPNDMELIGNIMADMRDINRSGLYVSPHIRDTGGRLNYYLMEHEGAKPLSELVADYGSLVMHGHSPKTFGRVIKDPEPILQRMNLRDIKRIAGQ